MTRPAVRLTLGLLLLGLTAVSPAAAGQNPSRPLTMQIVEFSWPLATGAVVPAGATAVTLERGMGFQMRFRLPADCAALTEAATLYGTDASPAFRSQYDQAHDFCGRARVFTLGSATAARDFVSRYNFTSLSLDVVPYEARCQGAASKDVLDLCARLRAKDNTACVSGTLPTQLTLPRFLLQYDGTTNEAKLDCRPVRVDPVSCRLQHGQFSGTLTARGGVVRCAPLAGGAPSPGVELQDVTYRDVNRDGVMDAILSVSEPGSSGATRAGWFVFALTRRSATAVLERVPLD